MPTLLPAVGMRMFPSADATRLDAFHSSVIVSAARGVLSMETQSFIIPESSVHHSVPALGMCMFPSATLTGANEVYPFPR